MARTDSQDLRDRVIDAALVGRPARQAAVRFGVGLAAAIIWVRRARETGERRARPQGQPRRSQLEPHRDKRREAWFEGQLDLDPARLVFIDETRASTAMARLRGRAPTCAGVRRKANGCGPASRKAIGKPRPSWRACGSQAWSRPWCWMAR